MTSKTERTREPRAAPVKHWAVGTLTYTAGGLAALFFWLLWGDFAWSMRDRAIPPVMQLLFRKYGASDFTIGLLFSSLPLGFALVAGPFISYFSDRHRGRYGRRIPYLLATIPVIVISILGLALSSLMDRSPHAAATGALLNPNVPMLVYLGAFWMLFEVGCGIANSVFGALVNDVVPQEVVGRFYGFFRALSLIAGIVFNYWIIGHAETRYAWIFAGLGALYGVGFGLMCFKVREGGYPPPPHAAAATTPLLARAVSAAKVYLRDGYGHSYYLWFFAATILAALAVTPVNLYSLLYAKSLGMDMTAYGRCQALTYAISLVLAYPLGALADRFHPLRLTIAALAFYAVATCYFGSHSPDRTTFAVALVIQSVISGCFLTVSASLPQRLLPRGKFASIGSAGGTISCLVGIFFAPGVGIFLDHTGHNYRNTFYVAFVLAILALLANLVLYRRFMALGGPGSYVAPLST